MHDSAQQSSERAWNLTRQALIAVLVLGVGLAFFEAGAGAVVIATSAGLLVASQIGIALVHYRRTMRRAWPAVPPLADDDW